ncbi:MAG: GDSL-type esterase/lipase family protein [Solirubrobacteraceae bacterium]
MTERDPFILDRATGRRLRARDAMLVVGIAVLLLVLFEGRSIRNQGEQMQSGIERTAVLAVGHPAGWIADRLPLADALDDLTAFLSPDDDISGPGSFEDAALTSAGQSGGAGANAGITPDYFDPSALGQKPARLPALRKLLVTGDSMAQPLDAQLARRLSDAGVHTVRDAHLGTGISTSEIVDWGQLSVSQVRKENPDAVVMFIGANDSFPMKDAEGRDVGCCNARWAALYATRARRMMDTFRRAGKARVYWLTLPLPRDAKRVPYSRAVNAAVAVAAQPFRSHVRVIDLVSVFTPSGFRSSMSLGAKNTIVRRADGIHLNDAGAAHAAGLVEARLRADFTSVGG